MRSILVLVLMATWGCEDAADGGLMPDARIRDAKIDVEESDADVRIRDARPVVDAAKPSTCPGAIIGDESTAPRPTDEGCGCFHSESPPQVLSCRSPSPRDCAEVGGRLDVLSDEDGSCVHECDIDGDNHADWRVSYLGSRTLWWVGQEDGSNRTEGGCTHGWSVYIIEPQGGRFGPALTYGDGRGCICWGDGGGVECPEGCTPPTRPLCTDVEQACDDLDIGDRCGIDGDHRDGTCQSNPDLDFEKACCI